jgi:hypothetical protein
MKTSFITLIIWSIGGLLFDIVLCEELEPHKIKKRYKMIIYCVISGPIMWIASIIIYISYKIINWLQD